MSNTEVVAMFCCTPESSVTVTEPEIGAVEKLYRHLATESAITMSYTPLNGVTPSGM